MLARLATDPRAFVERQSNYPGIRTQGVFVALAGLAFGLQHYGNFALLDESAGHVTGPLWVLPIADLLVAFLLWGVVTVVVYYVARPFEGYFAPEVLFRMVGWGFVPLIASGLLRSLGRLYALRDAAPPAEPSIAGFEHEFEQYQLYVEPASSDPVFLGATLAAIPFLLYSGYVWALIVEHLGDVEFREAAVVAVVPTLICLAWLVWPLL